MRKRITSLLLTLVMLLSLVPAMGVTASAAEPEWMTVNTFDQLKEAMQQGTKTNIKLGKDINTNDEENHKYGLTTYDQILVGNTITLDLNGKKLTLNSGQNQVSSYINVTNGNLTVQDNVGGGEIFLNDEYKGGSTLILLLDTATFTLKSGTIRATTKPETSGIDLIQSYGTVNIEGGTLTCTQTNGEIGRLHSEPNHWTSCYALKCFASDRVQTTITGGEFTGFVRIPVKNNGKQNKITNATFDGSVVLDLADEKNMTWSKPGLTVEDAEVKGTLFINGVCYHEKSTDIAIVIGNGWYATLDVNDTNVWVYDYDLFKQTYEANGNDVSKATFKQGYAPYQLKGGTYRFMNFGSKAEHDIGYRYTQEAFRHILGNGAIKVGNYDDDGYKIYTYSNIGESFKYGDYMVVMNSSWKRIPFIPNAWGVKSVTLDGKEINYAKDWQGGFENLTNDKAHTIKFEWNPLADELKKAGYSYRAECDRYVSGNKTPTTDPISATDNEYSFTIPAGAEPKVYSFALHLNLKNGDKNVGIFSNEHIVKLVVKQAAVVEPVPTLAGKVYYTSGIVYDRSISTGTGNLPHGFDRDKLLYQWQRSTNSGDTWENIPGETSGSYKPVAADMGDDVRIRVVVTAEGYLGEIVGAAVKVSKAANDSTPVPSTVVARKDGSDTYTKFEITDFNPNQEYVYTSSPDNSGEWPTGGTPINSATVEGLSAGSTYFIYTRCKETNTHQPGSKIISSSVLLDEETRLNRIILTDASGKEYSSYGNGNTIYIKKGESMTLTATKNPGGANKWSDFTFEPQYSSSAFTVTDPTGPVVSGATITSVTIRGEEVGTGTLAAKYSGYTPRYYGTWGIHVYEDVKDIGTSAEITVSPSFPDTTMYVGDTMTLPEYDVTVYPKGALDNYNLAWRIIKTGMGATYPMSDANITLEDGKIKAEAAHTGGEKTLLGLVAIDKTDSTKIISLSPTSRFYVTVTEAPTIALTGVTVAPTKVNLNIGGSIQLSAVREPVNATGDLSWSSDNETVATVDSNGKVTAVAKGEATITVTCGKKTATCTVTVDHQQHDYSGQPYLYLDPGNHYQECKAGDGYNIQAHEFTAWADNGNDTHSRHCTVCKKSGEAEFYTETANHDWQWVVDSAATPNAAGKKHEKCPDCHARRSENTEIPMLTSIMVEHLTVAKPVKDVAAAKATTTDNAYYVANTEWTAADGTPLAIGDKFQPGTVYTVKITLETAGADVFSAKSAYNDIEGKKATLTSALTGDNYADSVILTYTFDKTAGGYHPGTGTGTGTTTYPITVKSAKNGDVTASHKSASKGTTVTLTVDPDKGYVLDTLTVLDGKDKEIKLTEKNGKYTFTMPASKVTVAATFKASAPTGKNPFIDVPTGSYYEDAVVWAVEKGITSGTSAVTFDPNGNCTRAQAVTFLWRAAGSPAPKTKVMPFTDVPSGSYYYDAVLWAMEQGITKGTSDTAFSPNASCTRAQIVTFLWRANGSPAVSGNSAFTDVASDAYYAAAVAWAEKNGVTGGIGNGLFGSGNNCTRAQIVTFIYRSVK